MSIIRTAVPLVVLTGVLTGCAGLQKTDWPTCAAVGGVGGAALGAIKSSAWAGVVPYSVRAWPRLTVGYTVTAMRMATVFRTVATSALIRPKA
ncbi:outer membrane porin F [Pseudomonas fragi]|uniref:Outer membrane porin F n=1 Tax=Pseudomonas fragi TaxID=296 RepID=A0A449IP86_PSEFR|nr:outer membrane porin F [Pseudomonas fragi]